ncbi:MAG: FecR domain-containing protein [Candidatus Omnitrophica bacterium]|nr:FecR domain-containing protein [Candidatus Omnitrophota bacterium]
MKTQAQRLIGALIVLSAFFFACFSACAEEQSQTYVNQPATINRVVGDVEYYSKDTNLWQEATADIQLNEGDQIRTGIGAKAELLLQDGSFIRLKENSSLAIIRARKQTDNDATLYNLDLRVGEIMLELQELSKGSEFKVKTPTAVAAVRGTTYYVRTGTMVVDGEEKKFVQVYVDEGTVEYTNTVSGESCIVPQGLTAIVFEDGTIEGPYPLPPEQQGSWTSGWEMVKVDDGVKKGMRDEDEEGGDDENGDDVDDLNENTGENQEGANQDQNNEQDIYGIAKVTVITGTGGAGGGEGGIDTDGDGVVDDYDMDDDNDGIYDTQEPEGPTDPLDPDSDGDGIDDFEDAFPTDPTVDPDTEFGAGYGSWEELSDKAAEMLAVEIYEGLAQDIGDMIDDIHARGYEAVKESIFDHQAGKVMTDYWGYRVRVEEYISQPAENQVQILALNLRTAGPNAGLSSMDFRTVFDRPVTQSLRDLPWGSYMSAYEINDLEGETGEGSGGIESDTLLVVYGSDPRPNNYPLPTQFSLEAKNPFGDSVKFIEEYFTDINMGELYGQPVWYQLQNGEDIETYINGNRYCYLDYDEAPIETSYWGETWETENRNTFIDFYAEADGTVNLESPTWLMGVFFLINDDGSLVTDVDEEFLNGDGTLKVMCPRNVINPLYNMEMVFFSSEFGDTDPGLPEDIFDTFDPSGGGSFSYADELAIYNANRSIDVITIPEITAPYYTPGDEPEAPANLHVVD